VGNVAGNRVPLSAVRTITNVFPVMPFAADASCWMRPTETLPITASKTLFGERATDIVFP
jgi:hypothetical protein